MSLQGVFAPMVRAYFKNLYGGGSGGDADAIIKAFAENTPCSLVSDAVTKVVEEAFEGAQVIEVNFPNADSVGYNAFNVAVPLVSASFASAKTIGNFAFLGCSNLENINLPSAVTIGINAFQGCKKLTQIALPCAETIESGVFHGCSKLSDVNLPLITAVPAHAFYNCEAIKKIDLPSVVSIGQNAFNYCNSLTAAILRTTSTVCVADLSAFDDTPMFTGEGHIYVPSAMFEYYRAGYDPAMTEAGYAGLFDIMFRKIEDYPEICG